MLKLWTIRCVALLGAAVVFGSAGYFAGAQDAKKTKTPRPSLKVGQLMKIRGEGGSAVVTAEEFVERITEWDANRAERYRIAEPVLNELIRERLLGLEADRLEVRLKSREVTAEVEQNLADMRAKLAQSNKELKADGKPVWTWKDWLEKRAEISEVKLRLLLEKNARTKLLTRLVIRYFEKSTIRAKAWVIECRHERQIKEAHARLLKGARFEDVARDVTISAATRAFGGLLGNIFPKDGHLGLPFTRRSSTPEGEQEVRMPGADAAFWKLEDGAHSKPVQGKISWFILRRTDTRLGNEAEFYDLRESCMASPDPDKNLIDAWGNATMNHRRYTIQRRMPGWDCKADELIQNGK